MILDTDDCLGVTCLHGGTCKDLLHSYNCSCAEGYTGAICETGKALSYSL